jgi:anti-sigma factor RsiW
VHAELSHREARGLFGALLDQELPARDAQRLRLHLEDCGDCRRGWARYEQSVSLVRKSAREKAPPDLAGQILRRVRRRKYNGLQAQHLAYLYHRVPIEAAIPVLLGILVAAILVLLAPQ